MEPSSPLSQSAPVAADGHAASSAATSTLPTRPDSRPALPHAVVVASVVVAAALPAILLGAIATVLIAANYNLLNWME